ncbi:futalosine hydrolase [Paenibacillus sp. IB182496]|uniref:Futalosine hydrolase n=1 Tax=Paenibacillus sabuli TaxID=2772509 RepID=A0A927BWM5_9BACL|nr:futalosine hydrolase [Paenibacillus sabuli]MBD2846859.1 futalosine hydrolase [Paenibacillus sabuli]
MHTDGYKQARRVLVVTAVEAEQAALQHGLGGDGRFTAVAVGAGAAMAAAGTMQALQEDRYDLVVSAGIGGGFVGRAAVGSLVVANAIVVADLGAQTAEGGFVAIDELGFGTGRFAVDEAAARQLHAALIARGLEAVLGPVLTVSTATGTAATAAELCARVPGAAAEGMEGGGVAAAAVRRGLPVLELRAISNAVGPRDRAAWRIGEALAALEAAGPVLLEVL